MSTRKSEATPSGKSASSPRGHSVVGAQPGKLLRLTIVDPFVGGAAEYEDQKKTFLLVRIISSDEDSLVVEWVAEIEPRTRPTIRIRTEPRPEEPPKKEPGGDSGGGGGGRIRTVNRREA